MPVDMPEATPSISDPYHRVQSSRNGQLIHSRATSAIVFKTAAFDPGARRGHAADGLAHSAVLGKTDARIVAGVRGVGSLLWADIRGWRRIRRQPTTKVVIIPKVTGALLVSNSPSWTLTRS